MRKTKGVLAFLTLFLFACAGSQVQQLTPKQQAAIWFAVYNSQYDGTMAIAVNPNATTAQKDMAMKTRDVLIRLHPLLKIYAMTVDGGSVPPEELNYQIIGLINLLLQEANK